MVKEIHPKTVLVYQDEYGNEPYTDWLGRLRDQKGRRAVLRRIGKLEYGHYGDVEPVGEGVSELRIFVGPGYRIYFGEDEGNVVILLCGGDKSSQQRDIKAAKSYWKEYRSHE